MADAPVSRFQIVNNLALDTFHLMHVNLIESKSRRAVSDQIAFYFHDKIANNLLLKNIAIYNVFREIYKVQLVSAQYQPISDEPSFVQKFLPIHTVVT